MFVGVCRLTLLAHQCHSLKEKRSVVRKIKDRVRARFHLGICEVGGQDTWQRIGLGFALVSTDRSKVEALVTEMVDFIEAMGLAEVAGDERDVLAYGDDPVALPGKPMRGPDVPDMRDMPDRDDDWIPDAWKSEDAEPEVP